MDISEQYLRSDDQRSDILTKAMGSESSERRNDFHFEQGLVFLLGYDRTVGG